PPLEAIGIADDAALTPFAGKYRFIDFALATMRNSRASSIYVMAPLPGPELRAHLARGELAGHRSDPPLLLPLPGEGGQGRSNRLRQTLAGCRELIRTHQPETIVVLLADHILQLDLRQLADAHDDLRADVTLAALPVPVGEATSRTVLRVAGDQRVHEVQRSPVLPATAPGSPRSGQGGGRRGRPRRTGAQHARVRRRRHPRWGRDQRRARSRGGDRERSGGGGFRPPRRLPHRPPRARAARGRRSRGDGRGGGGDRLRG